MNENTTLITTSAALMPAMDIGQAVARYQAMGQFVKQILKEGTDFGIIPGTGNKPTLLKAGAEKLTSFFGLRPIFQIVEKVEDWTGQDHHGEAFFYYHYRCQLYRGDMIFAEGDGSCNSWESKYRYRWVGEDELPDGIDVARLKKRIGSVSEFDFAIDKAETSGKYGKPPEYWQRFQEAIEAGAAARLRKKTRAGKEFDAWEINTTVFRIPNDDVASQVNTIQKMAQKRALVAATLIGVNASDYFTQDIEDLVDSYVEGEYSVIPTETSTGEVPTQKPTKTSKPKANGNGAKASVGTSKWADTAKALAERIPYYMDKNGPNYHHMLGAALKLGFEGVTDANLDEVIAKLEEYANAQANQAAAE